MKHLEISDHLVNITRMQYNSLVKYIPNGRVFSWLAWWRMIRSSSYCFCGTSEGVLLCHLRDVLISLSHTRTYVYMYVCTDTLEIIDCVIVPFISGIYLILKYVFRPLYMAEIQIGDALLVLLVMQGFHLSQTGFRSYLGILCLWTMGSHFHLIGALRLIFRSKSISSKVLENNFVHLFLLFEKLWPLISSSVTISEL